MNSFCRQFITEWRKNELPFKDACFIAGISGGADSVSLLLVLKELSELKKFDIRIIIAHFNHGFRGEESKADEIFVKELSEKLGFEFVSEKGKIKEKGNLEQNAREARYDFLKRKALESGANGILTAHTINDQAETFLLNLIRGSGSDGLSAMKTISEFSGEIKLIRPLLSWAKREDTEAYCHLHKTEFREDSMNLDENFARVRIRRKIIPLLRELNPKIIETLSATAGLMQRAPKAIVTETNTLQIAHLISLDKANLYSLLRAWIKHHRKTLRQINLKHIEAIERLIKSPKSGRMIELPGNSSVSKKNGALHFGNRG